MFRISAFVLRLLPMLPSKPLQFATRKPIVEEVLYPTSRGDAAGQVYRPPGRGRHRGVVVCLGVVPFGVDHPQVPRLGDALARAGFAALLYWSPAMRDFRLDPTDIGDIALAYDWLVGRSYVDPARSGLMGTCVGGSFALMAAAHPLIRERVRFVTSYAPYSSLRTFARDIVSSTTSLDGQRRSWAVDPLTRKVFVHSVTAPLEGREAALLRQEPSQRQGVVDMRQLSTLARAVYPLTIEMDPDSAGAALDALPGSLHALLDVMSPLTHVGRIRAPLIVLLHDRGDRVIPVSESRQLDRAFGERSGVRYHEMDFQHLDPSRLPLVALARAMGKLYVAMYPVFR